MSTIHDLMDFAVTVGLAVGGLFAALAITVIASDYVDGWSRRRALTKLNIPIIDEGSNMSRILRWEWNTPPFDYGAELEKAYEKYSKANKPFAARIQHHDYAVALPLESCREWRVLPVEHLSFGHALSRFSDLSQHMDVIDRTPVEAVISCSTQAELSRFQEHLAMAAEKHIDAIAPAATGKSWTTLESLQCVGTFSSRIAASLLLGDPAHPLVHPIAKAGLSHAHAIFTSLLERTKYPRILRPFAWWALPKCRELQAGLSLLRGFLKPEIERRIALARGGSTFEGPRCTVLFSFIDVLISATFRSGRLSVAEPRATDPAAVELLVQQLVLYHFELATGTGANAVCMITRVLNAPEYMTPLREEIATALQRSGGEWKGDILAQAPKLESFCRETFRMDNIAIFINIRLVMKPLTLTTISPPLTLPPGTMIMTPNRPVHRDSTYYPNPNTFNGYRFYDPDTNTCRPRVSTTSPTYLSFAHGTGSCPARIFATQVARVMFVKILMAFELRVAGGNRVPSDREGWGVNNPFAGSIYLPRGNVRVDVKRRG